MEKTFPRLVQTGEGSSINSTGSQIYGEKPPPSGSDGGRFLHKFDREQNLEEAFPPAGSAGGKLLQKLDSNQIHLSILETRVMLKF